MLNKLLGWMKATRQPRERHLGWGGYSGYHIVGTDVAPIQVSPEVAMTASAFYSCVTYIAKKIGSLPVSVVDLRNGGRVPDHPVSVLLRAPNDLMTQASLFESMVMNLLPWGNAYAVIDREGGRPVGLRTIRASNTMPRMMDGQVGIVTHVDGQTFSLPLSDVLHVPGQSFDGLIGLSPVEWAARTVGVSVALEQFAQTYFQNGANVQHVIELPMLPQDQLDEFKRRWQSEYAGPKNAHKTAAMPGLKVHRMGNSPEEAQAVDSRRQAAIEVSRLFHVPPHIINDLERASYATVEQEQIRVREDAIEPWTVKLEQELERKLLTDRDRQTFGIKFDLDALIRADTAARTDALIKSVGGPYRTVNEARRVDGLEPVEGGDRVMSPLNQDPIDSRFADEPVHVRDQTAAVEEREDPPDESDPLDAVLLLARLVRHLRTKEQNAIRRAAKKCNGDRGAFAAAVASFFEGHDRIVVDQLPGVADERWALEYIDRSRSELLTAYDGGDLDGVLARWTEPDPVIKTLPVKQYAALPLI